jgi:hypothetical protein
MQDPDLYIAFMKKAASIVYMETLTARLTRILLNESTYEKIAHTKVTSGKGKMGARALNSHPETPGNLTFLPQSFPPAPPPCGLELHKNVPTMLSWPVVSEKIVGKCCAEGSRGVLSP